MFWTSANMDLSYCWQWKSTSDGQVSEYFPVIDAWNYFAIHSTSLMIPDKRFLSLRAASTSSSSILRLSLASLVLEVEPLRTEKNPLASSMVQSEDTSLTRLTRSGHSLNSIMLAFRIKEAVIIWGKLSYLWISQGCGPNWKKVNPFGGKSLN